MAAHPGGASLLEQGLPPLSCPEEEGRWALPHGEFGLDLIALVGTWRFADHRSVPAIHQRLQSRSIQIAERTVLN